MPFNMQCIALCSPLLRLEGIHGYIYMLDCLPKSIKENHQNECLIFIVIINTLNAGFEEHI